MDFPHIFAGTLTAFDVLSLQESTNALTDNSFKFLSEYTSC